MERLTVGRSEVQIGGDARASILPPRSERSRVVVFTQPGAATLAEEIAGVLGASVWVLPDRDEAKTLEQAARAYTYLTQQGVDRQGTLVAVGGGSVCDLVGFVASTYLRGIEVVSVPTTLLAAVDASIGGKTAVNLEAKNQIGTFWEPTRIVIDLDVLRDLPAELVRDGMAEIAKAGLIGDERLVAELEKHGLDASLERIVPAAIRVKAKIVEQDPLEHGVRMHLNYGHTVGHAVERLAGLSHGEAVSVGMVAAANIARVATGFDSLGKHRALLQRLELPTTCRADPDAVLRLIEHDKKRDTAGVRMVLLRGVGDPVVRHVDEAALTTALSDTLR